MIVQRRLVIKPLTRYTFCQCSDISFYASQRLISVIADRFVCETEVTDTVKSGTIVVVVDNQYTAESDSPFSFVVSFLVLNDFSVPLVNIQNCI